ncbi:MAG: acyl carrier protein [Erysipelotrichaceae bacterium]|nr:acyl carrier protein [Erysipelotrichaceae bacterium]
MNKEEILNILKSILVYQLGVADTSVTFDAYFVDDLGADSLDYIEIVMAVEEAFDIEIPDEAIEYMYTVNDAVKYIENQLMQ